MGKYTPNPTIRILMLGSTSVGKNCLESRFTTMTYPPPYDPALTLNSRRFFTLSPQNVTDLDAAVKWTRALDTQKNGEGEKKETAIVSAAEQPRTTDSNGSQHAADNKHLKVTTDDINARDTTEEVTGDDNYSLDDRTLVASETCSECARENNTYLIEVINYPSLQSAKVRTQVHNKAEYDAIMLVYDINDRSSFESVRGLHSEIPVCTRRNHYYHHRKAAPHASATRSRTSGWFGGGDNNSNNGSGEIVVCLVGNKADTGQFETYSCINNKISGRETGAPLPRQDVEDDRNNNSVENNLMHPAYPGSITYEQLIADLADQERAKTTGHFLIAPAMQTRQTTPPTPFPQAGEPSRSPVSPSRTSSEKNGDIEKWLQTGELTTKETGDIDVDYGKRTATAVGNSNCSLLSRGTEMGTAATGHATTFPGPTVIEGEPTLSVSVAAAPVAESTRPHRQVSAEEGEALARSLKLTLPFCETSAKTGSYVEIAFERLIREAIRELGRDATGTNKASKTCRHRISGGVNQKSSAKYHQQQPARPHHNHNVPVQGIASGATKTTAVSSTMEKASPAMEGRNGDVGGIHAVHGVTVQRPDSIAIINNGKSVLHGEEENVSGVDAVAVANEHGITMPRQARRRESMMERMRKMFVRKSQTPMVLTDIAV